MRAWVHYQVVASSTTPARHFPFTSVDDFAAVVDWIHEVAGRVDVRWEDVPDVDSLTQTVAVTLPVTEPVGEVSAVTIEGPYQRVVGVMRDLEYAYAKEDLTEAYGGGYLI